MKHQCQGKKAYAKKDAQTFSNYAKKKYGAIFRVYQCPECNLFHLSTKGHNREKL